jgi:HSP20 family molecular chaperone IbpA
MSFFDDNNDGFESIIDQFFGGSRPGSRRKQEFIRGEEEERNIDFIESKDSVYFVFELPGFSEKEVMVVVKGKDLEINAIKRNGEGVAGYLVEKLRRGISFNRELPKIVDSKKFSHTMRNGVLEIKFGRRR